MLWAMFFWVTRCSVVTGPLSVCMRERRDRRDEAIRADATLSEAINRALAARRMVASKPRIVPWHTRWACPQARHQRRSGASWWLVR